MTMYISLQKAVHSDNKIGTMYLITGIIIAGTIFGMFAYSKRTMTCKNCGTRHYATFDKCPVCLNPVKHRIVRKKQ
jgi:rubrerythrin